MTLDELFDYLEEKAVQSPDIPHDPANKKLAFHAVDDPYDLEEFDKALRNFAVFPAMLAEHIDGELDDNNSANYTEDWNVGFMIVDRRNGKEAIRDVRARCMRIGRAIIVQMRKDGRPGRGSNPGVQRFFRIERVGFTPVGPMMTHYWGYLFTFRFICPFSF